MAVRYEGSVAKTLRNWIEKHAADKVVEVHHGGGFCFDNGGGVGYDVLLAPGYCVTAYSDGAHTVIERTARDVIYVLSTIEECRADDECRQAWAARDRSAAMSILAAARERADLEGGKILAGAIFHVIGRKAVA